MIVTAVRQQEVPVVTELVRAADSEAFIIINEAREVIGEGFKPIPIQPRPKTPRAIRKIRLPSHRRKV